MLIMIEGFDHQDPASATADIEEKWIDTDTANIAFESSTYDTPQGEGQSLVTNSTSDLASLGEISSIYLNRNASYGTGIIGFHYRHVGLTSNYATPFFRLVQRDPSSVTQMSLSLDQNGSLVWHRGTTAIYQSQGWRYINNYSYGTSWEEAWIHLEIKYKIANSISANDCIVRVNGAEVLNLPAGADTQPSTYGIVNGFQFVGGATYKRFFDNVYWICLTGVGDTDFINTNGGGIYVQTMIPSGDATSLWIPYPNLGEYNYEDVDDIPDDGDTTYCKTETTDSQNSFDYGKPQQYDGFDLDLETTDDIHGVQITSRLRAEDASDEAHFSHLAEKAGTEWHFEPTNTGHLTTSYKYYISTISVDPSTGSDWTRAYIDSYEFGVKRGDYPDA